MSQQALMFATYDNPLVLCESADFDGTNDYMTRGASLTGAADSKTGILSFWFRTDGGNGTDRTILMSATTLAGATPRFRLRHTAANTIGFIGVNAAGTIILNLSSTTAYLAAATWYHCLSSWNLAVGGSQSLYITDVSDLTTTTFTDDTVDYTVADWAVGAQADGSTKYDGCLAELYFAPGQYLDFSNAYNRRKFISATSKPVSLGPTGSLPTGTAPIVYQRIADGAAADTFDSNLGSGGDFTITGTLSLGSTTPSD